MTTDDDIAVAAEYVLGTLDADERAGVAVRIASDPTFAAEVARWERRLGELNGLVAGVEPPAAVWERIKGALNGTPRAAMRLPEVPAPAIAGSGNVIALRRRVTRWQYVSGTLGALAAALLAVVVTATVAPDALPPLLRPKPVEVVKTVEIVKTVEAPAPGRFVAVLQQNADAPAFILTVDVAARSFVVRRVSAEPQPGKSYELWLVSNRFPAPRSLGLVGTAEFEPRTTLSGYDPSVINEATYAVSEEPEGGSPTGAPTGRVVFTGKLVEAVPPGR